MRRIITLFTAKKAEINLLLILYIVWAKIAECSPDAALRDIQDLINEQILRKEGVGRRSTNYELAEV